MASLQHTLSSWPRFRSSKRALPQRVRLSFVQLGKVSVLFLRIALGFAFLAGSLPKMRQPYDFLSTVYEYELVGPELGMLVAMILPWFELFLGACLLGGVFLGGAFLSTIMLMALFTFAQASAVIGGLDIACGCFATSSKDVVGFATITRTVLLLLGAVAAYTCLLTLPPNPKPQADWHELGT